MGNRVIAIGDSIVNGNTVNIASVPGQSWAKWAAEANGYEYEQHARGGATSTEIVRDFLPHVTAQYAWAAFNMGTNDLAGKVAYSDLDSNARAAAEHLAEHAERVVVLSVPSDPRADAVIREVASEYGLILIDGTLSGHRQLRPDGLHPNALGQLEIGDRCARALGIELPSSTASIPDRLGVGFWAEHLQRSARVRAGRVKRALTR